MKKKKYLIGGIVLGLAMIALVYNAFAKSSVYYYEVGEILARQSDFSTKEVRLGGKVAPAPINWDASSRVLKFTVTDGTRTLPVEYKGVVPDNFTVDTEVIVQGTYRDGVFQGTNLVAKCASKYVPKS